MTTPPPPPGSGGNQPYDPTGSSPYPSGSGSTPGLGSTPGSGSTPPPSGSSYPSAPGASYGSSGPGAPQGNPYGSAPNQYGAPKSGSDSTKILALVSMGFGIVGVVLCCCWALPIFPIVALVTGFIARNQTKTHPRPDLKTFITVGLATGALGLVIAVLYWILVAAGVIDLNATYNY
ncbi:DUF4190 domain-containing protein [Janibacter melonis]|uniref:DUF4190 domain-containing protein n=1 Tax=Janibacter melonis TaxID=262209 RepID=UPI00174CB2BB|nr:DUF4190 domain-containing protein [Janibacter melonis]